MTFVLSELFRKVVRDLTEKHEVHAFTRNN